MAREAYDLYLLDEKFLKELKNNALFSAELRAFPSIEILDGYRVGDGHLYTWLRFTSPGAKTSHRLSRVAQAVGRTLLLYPTKSIADIRWTNGKVTRETFFVLGLA